jgi:hypothetical protein
MKDHRVFDKKQTVQAAAYFKTLVRQMVLDKIDPWIDRQVAAFLDTAANQAAVTAEPYRAARDLADCLIREMSGA